ncbi:acyltransferase family protein [Olivibacter sp. SDN3]|uniref:acyltransferase family protein n=1 Tax=Olivibacter sp. SDN3 TaxID=2764720 RepID=UPI0016511DAC|nr:acyltransferase family protein [Olivibacter sp. SDN3]QNL50941.1 acyltransferase family protein [Olivibacter sp. SDN3]
MSTPDRRYDIDWIRVIAIGLLLIYHVAIGMQPWGAMIAFITSEKSWEALWVPMTMLNVWRIPLLFFVSGMGVYFASRKRNWKQLFLERGKRILLPFLFGSVFIVPIHIYIWQKYNGFEISYLPGPGHLWFLGNIFIYVLVLSPLFFYLKGKEDGQLVGWIKRVFSHPLGLFLVVGAFVTEVLLLDPMPFEMYAMTCHGFFIGLLAFFFGFCFVRSGDTFWQMIQKWRWLLLTVAIALFVTRLIYYQPYAPNYLLAVESTCWIISVFAFGHRYLNHSSRTLSYLSEAAYPVYIIHMIFLYLGSSLIFPLPISAPLQFLLVLLFTLSGCLITYEFVIRRIAFVRPLFGLK